MTVLAALAPAGFEIYAFKKVFELFPASDPLVWASLGVTIALLVSATSIMLAVHSSPLRSPRPGPF